jgi:hypothetical protein
MLSSHHQINRYTGRAEKTVRRKGGKNGKGSKDSTQKRRKILKMQERPSISKE